MKPTLLLFVSLLLTMTGCQNSKRSRATTANNAAPAMTSLETVREEKLHSLRNETEARAKTYEKRGYSSAEAHALAEAEYFRSGK